MSMSLGLSISGGSMNRVRASRTMDTQRAMRKTALKKAPRISARTHYGSVLVVNMEAWALKDFGDIHQR